MTTLAIEASYEDAIEREWSRLARPGTWFTGPQRLAIARQARAAVAEAQIETPQIAAAIITAARAIAATPSDIRSSDVQGLFQQGLTGVEYIEILGIVARLCAVDTFEFGMGTFPRALPLPIEGEPSRTVVAEAKLAGGWAPTVGAAFPTTALSAVPPENEGMEDIAAAFYISIEEMADLEIVRGLQRDQMEVVAARTSLINDCFF